MSYILPSFKIFWKYPLLTAVLGTKGQKATIEKCFELCSRDKASMVFHQVCSDFRGNFFGTFCISYNPWVPFQSCLQRFHKPFRFRPGSSSNVCCLIKSLILCYLVSWERSKIDGSTDLLFLSEAWIQLTHRTHKLSSSKYSAGVFATILSFLCWWYLEMFSPFFPTKISSHLKMDLDQDIF